MSFRRPIPLVPTVLLFLLPFGQVTEPEPPPQEPLRLQAEMRPPQVAQGEVGLIVVKTNRPISGVEGGVAGRSLVFDWSGDTAWAYAPFNSTATLGPRQATVFIKTLGGEQAWATVSLEVVAGSFDVEQITVPPGQESLLDPEILSREWATLLGITSGVTYQRYWREPFTLPAQGWLSSHYGTRRSYNGGPAVEPHQGTDIAAPAGAPVVAANSGFAYVRSWHVRGNAVLIDHGLGLWSGYYHLAEIAIVDAQYVNQGQVIGWLGATGLATGPHLHWDMVLQGVHTSPLAWTKVTAPY